jgi:hypothetical protein
VKSLRIKFFKNHKTFDKQTFVKPIETCLISCVLQACIHSFTNSLYDIKPLGKIGHELKVRNLDLEKEL